MLSIDEINELQTKNKELENIISRQTAQYNSLLNKYVEIMNIAKNLWKQLNSNKTVKESLESIQCLEQQDKIEL